MKTVGFPISHKENENRRAIVPSDLKKLTNPSHVFIESGFGSVLGMTDDDFASVGCQIKSHEEVLKADIICDPKIGDADYLEKLHKSQTIFGWIHATQNRDITDKIIASGLTAYAWEHMFEGGRHTFWFNNELAGEAAVLHAFQCYGRLPFGLKVAVIGNGNTARGAVRVLNMLGAHVMQYGRKTEQLLRDEINKYDVIVNCILWDVNRKDHVVSKQDLKRMKSGSMIIDGNMTVNGFYQTAQNASDRATRIGGNLCVSDSGAIVSKGTSDLFLVNGNVWMPGPQNLWYGSVEKFGCMCNVYSTYWETNGQLLRTESCTGNWNNYPEKGVLTSCAGSRLTNSSDNQSSYDKIILGDSASDMIFISSALSLSTYNSTLRSKSFTENSNYKKYCPDGKKISSNDEWSIGVYAEGSGTCADGQPENYTIPSSQKNICGTWGSPHWKDWSPSAYYVLYSRGWENWGGGSHKPYPAVTDAEKKYAIYYTGGTTDVNFGLYELSDWYVLNRNVTDQQRQIRLVGVRSDNSHGGNGCHGSGYYVFKPDPANDQMGGKFSSPVSVGAYYVGGDVFYDVGAGTYNGYNYDMTANVATGSPYCKKGSDDYRPVCGVTPWFKANGTVSSSLPYEREFNCAEGVMTDCYSIWEPSDHGCDGSKFLVDDPVCTPFDDYAGYATKGCAASITTWGQSGFESALNSCYATNAASDSLRQVNLYNGYLVVRISSSNSNYTPDANNPLNGRFIIIVDNKLGPGQNGLPKTTSDSRVFLYLNNGASYLQKELEHYFIYINNSSQKIESSNLKLTGTLYSHF